MTKQGLISALNKQTDSTIELTINIPWKKIEKVYQKTLNKLAKKTLVKGFRKGKAPKRLVEKKLGKSAIYQEVLKTLIPQVYVEALKEHKLSPVINPQIKIISSEEKKDWQIQAITCELPKVDLGDYKEAVRKALAPEKIWTPGKDKKEDAEKTSENKQLEKVFKTLLETAKVQISSLLIEDEVNRMLSRLIDQTNRLGLTVGQYLASIGKTSKQLRQEYQKQAEETLKLELILSAVANDQKIEVSDEEVKKMIQAAPDEKTRKALKTPAQKAYIRQLLRKRQAIDRLMRL